MNSRTPALVVLLLGCQEPSQQLDEYEYAVATNRVEALGWVGAGASEEEAREAARSGLENRLAAFDLGLTARLEADGSVVVGPLGNLASSERAAVDGMVQSVGVLELFVPAEGGDLRGIDLEAERERAAAWCEGGKTANEYSSLRPRAGGPAAGLTWAQDSTGALVPLVLPDRPERAFGASLIEQVHEWKGASSHNVLITVEEADMKVVEGLQQRAGERRVALVIEGRCVLVPLSEHSGRQGLMLEDLEPSDGALLGSAKSRSGIFSR